MKFIECALWILTATFGAIQFRRGRGGSRGEWATETALEYNATSCRLPNFAWTRKGRWRNPAAFLHVGSAAELVRDGRREQEAGLVAGDPGLCRPVGSRTRTPECDRQKRDVPDGALQFLTFVLSSVPVGNYSGEVGALVMRFRSPQVFAVRLVMSVTAEYLETVRAL